MLRTVGLWLGLSVLWGCGGVEPVAACHADADCEGGFCDLRFGLCALGDDGRFAGLHLISPVDGSRWQGEVPLEVELELKPGRERRDPDRIDFAAALEGGGVEHSQLVRVDAGRFRGLWRGKSSGEIWLQAYLGDLRS